MSKLRLPVVSLPMQEPRQLNQIRIARAVIQPQSDKRIVLPAEFAPTAQGAGGRLRSWYAK